MSYARFRKRLEALLAVAPSHDQYEVARELCAGLSVELRRHDERYFLLCAAGGFRAQTNQIRQIVFSVKGLPEGYLPRNIR